MQQISVNPIENLNTFLLSSPKKANKNINLKDVKFLSGDISGGIFVPPLRTDIAFRRASTA